MTTEPLTDQSIGVPAGGVPAQFLAAALDLIADGVVLVDTEGTIHYANRPLGALFGYELADLAGQPIEMLVPISRRDDHRRERAEYCSAPTRRSMGRVDLDIEGRRADGSHFPIDIQLSPLPGTELVTATVRDMSDERRAAADRALGRLDLAATADRVVELIAFHDEVIQRLFALGAHFEAHATREAGEDASRYTDAASRIDDLINVVRKQISGGRAC